MWGSFGSVIFEFLRSPEGLTKESEHSLAEHDIAGGKALLEWTGEKLTTITLSLKLQALKTDVWELDPEKELSELEELYKKHEPQPLFFGKKKIGYFVIEKIREVLHRVNKQGQIIYAEIELTLKEAKEKEA